MRRYGRILSVALALTIVTGAAGAFAGERGDWGKVLCVGSASDGGMLLIENDRGIHAVVVDPYGVVETRAGQTATLGMLKQGDHIDVAVSTWAGMQIVDLVVIAPRLSGKLLTAR
jgi:hypothetical protein